MTLTSSAPLHVSRLHEADFASIAWPSELIDVTRESIRLEFEKPWSRIWIAREPIARDRVDDSEANVLAALVTWHVVDELHILNVETRESARRRGCARALFESAIDYAREAQIVRFFLEVRAGNIAATALYLALGFEEINVRKGYYADGEDGREMMLRVESACIR